MRNLFIGQKLTSSHKVSIKRLGEKEHNLTQRAILGKSNDYVYGPGSLYQIDSTVAEHMLYLQLIIIR